MPLTKLLRKVERFIAKHPLWQSVVEWTRHHSLPGLKRIPIYNLIQFVIKELQKEALMTRANSMAFSFFLAIFPSIIFLITLLPYLPYGDDFFVTLHQSIREMIPGQGGNWVFETIQDLLKNERVNLLSAGFVLAIWFASNGMMSMMDGLKKEFGQVFTKHGFFQARFIAIQLTFLLSMTLFASMVLVIWGNTILNFVFQYIKADWLTKMFVFAFRWIVILLLFYTGISLIYRYGSTLRKRIPFINAGATLATVLSIGASWGFSFYADNFAAYNTIYGSIGTVIAFMLWIQINCFVLLVGFELNAGIAVIRSQREESEKRNVEKA